MQDCDMTPAHPGLDQPGQAVGVVVIALVDPFDVFEVDLVAAVGEQEARFSQVAEATADAAILSDSSRDLRLPVGLLHDDLEGDTTVNQDLQGGLWLGGDLDSVGLHFLCDKRYIEIILGQCMPGGQ